MHRLPHVQQQPLIEAIFRVEEGSLASRDRPDLIPLLRSRDISLSMRHWAQYDGEQQLIWTRVQALMEVSLIPRRS